MWIRDEVLYPRFLRSLSWMIFLHYVFVNSYLLLFKTVSWYPFSGIIEWMLYNFHWKTAIYMCILSVSVAAFGALNIRFCAVEKHINSTRFEKICRTLSPFCLQHVFATMCLGGIAAYCYDGLFHNFQNEGSFIDSCLSTSNDFEQSFVIGHGCFTGVMFSLKYFICNMYLIKFTLDQKSKVDCIKHQMHDLLKESFFCVLKAIHWYYIIFIVFGSPLKVLTFSYLGNPNSENESILQSIYSLLNPKLFFITILSGMMISYVWSLYLVLFNAFATEFLRFSNVVDFQTRFLQSHHVFPINLPVKGDKSRTLGSALACKDLGYLKYLAVLDLRLLSQFDSKRRAQIFTISHPGGHPHEWKEISKICTTSLQDFVYNLSEYSFAAAAASESKTVPPKVCKIAFERIRLNCMSDRPDPSFTNKILSYLREKPAISYFFDELPNAKLMKLFASSQPFIWTIDALGYLVSASYSEDRFGVVQQSLPDIIRLLLDIKMAEEKMPIGSVGKKVGISYVRDPQGRYEHIHQRLSLKITVNNALCKIASTFKEDIKGIYLPEEYQKYFQRYLSQKN